MNASRRRLLTALATAPVLALTACGFALRQTQDFPFKSLYGNFSETSPLGVELRRNLLGSGRIDLVTDPKKMPDTDAILDILSEVRQQVVVGMNASGQVREMQLRLRIRFGLRTPQGEEWIEPVELYQQRDLSFTETAALSKEIEMGMMYRDMQSDIVQQIMRRLASVKVPAAAAAQP